MKISETRREVFIPPLFRAFADPFRRCRHVSRRQNEVVEFSRKTVKIVVCDFGGRAGSALRWVQALRQGREQNDLVYLGIGSEIAEGFGAEAAENMKAVAAAGLVTVSADDMLTRAVEKVGPRAFYEGLDASWEGMRSAGIKGFKVRWGEGMEDVIKGWDSLARGEVGSDEGLAFKI